ncbi:MAG: DNA-directed RNA polymerase [Acidilobaceae archaeon]
MAARRRDEDFLERAESLYYGIKDVPVYYRCVQCGYEAEIREITRLPSLMCPKCGYRVFVKVRAPPQSGHIKKVKAI